MEASSVTEPGPPLVPNPGPEDLENPLQFKEKFVVAHAGLSLPSSSCDVVCQLGLTEVEHDSLGELSTATEGAVGPRHKLLGHPNVIQNDMELECQLVSNGVYCGDSEGYRSKEAAALSPGAADWMLLLQIDSDDDTGMMWGDAGMLYFWIRRQDLAARAFDRVWMILQCG